MANIKMTNQGNTYKIQSTSKELNRMIGHQLFVAYSEDIIEISDDDLATIIKKSNGRLFRLKATNAATDAQLRYIANLGVDIKNAHLTKSQASQIIDAVKSGDGIGSLGFSFLDGSN